MAVVPKQGDFVWLDAEPHAGHEIGGHDPAKQNIARPFLVVSTTEFNQNTPFVQVMPITHTLREDDPLMMQIIDSALQITGMVLFAQLKGYDYQARHGAIIGHCRPNVLKAALKVISNIYGL
ncbi:type II toxin-antitoxin system PemK/MazF family toxin [Loigolactobacillus zhaoyuanensis]|uniref:Type II toxin-antitoxin system PemK/MazF family toxin n=1 Tax=Loigolactobacillus zhaoyuanensis TaxID=2486017 RepID=A0ABW8UCV5_9LACO